MKKSFDAEKNGSVRKSA